MDHTHLGAYGALAVPAERRASGATAQPATTSFSRMDGLAQRIARDIGEQQRVRDGLLMGALLGVSLMGLTVVLA